MEIPNVFPTIAQVIYQNRDHMGSISRIASCSSSLRFKPDAEAHHARRTFERLSFL